MGGSSSKSEDDQNDNRGVLNGNKISNSIEIEHIDSNVTIVEYLLWIIVILLVLNGICRLFEHLKKKTQIEHERNRRLDNLVPPAPVRQV